MSLCGVGGLVLHGKAARVPPPTPPPRFGGVRRERGRFSPPFPIQHAARVGGSSGVFSYPVLVLLLYHRILTDPHTSWKNEGGKASTLGVPGLPFAPQVREPFSLLSMSVLTCNSYKQKAVLDKIRWGEERLGHDSETIQKKPWFCSRRKCPFK